MKLCNLTCDKCGNALVKYGLSIWNFYTKEWMFVDAAILCPRCDKTMELPREG